MDEQKFTWGGALKVVFHSVGKSPAHLAEFYIDRDRTLVYRWMRDEAAPPEKLLPSIVRFVAENCVGAERVKLKAEMDAYIRKTALGSEIKDALAGEGDFEKYISGVLRIALAERRYRQAEAPAATPGAAVPLASIVYALLAALSGGLIWNLLNRLFGWLFYMGGSGNEPAGAPAFLWGLIMGAPIIAFALLSQMGAQPSHNPPAPRDWRLVAAAYPLAAGAAGFVFYNSGVRGYVEGFGYAYGMQEAIIVSAYAALLSFLPLLSILALLRFPHMGWRRFAAIVAAPVVASILCVLGTMIVGRPEPEVAQLRGFAVGLALRLSMFVAARAALAGVPTTRPVRSSTA